MRSWPIDCRTRAELPSRECQSRSRGGLGWPGAALRRVIHSVNNISRKLAKKNPELALAELCRFSTHPRGFKKKLAYNLDLRVLVGLMRGRSVEGWLEGDELIQERDRWSSIRSNSERATEKAASSARLRPRTLSVSLELAGSQLHPRAEPRVDVCDAG